MISPVPASYLEDASGVRGHAAALFVPASEAELAAVLAEASRTATPVTIAGAGTGVTGGRVAQGGWIVSTEQLLRLEVTGSFARVGAGVLLKDLQIAARARGRFYAPDPTETSASIGGTVATNASGSRSFRYGDTRRHVRALRVAFADGTVREFRRGETVPFDIPATTVPGTTKHSAGFRLQPGMDWLDLFVGSEGTLGVVTEAELALLPLPEHLLTGVVFFDSEEAALAAVDAWRQVAGLQMLEYFDRDSLALLRERHEEIPGHAGAALLIEQEGGGSEAPAQWMDRLIQAGADADASWFGESSADRERFRRFRHSLPELVNDRVRRNGFLKLGSDYAVPVARNREMMSYYRMRLDAEFARQSVVFGHIGDAHVHVNILPENAGQFERGGALMLEFAQQAVALGGTVGAEHGLGKRKAHLLSLQYSGREIGAMREIKRRLDPLWLLGRGTLFTP